MAAKDLDDSKPETSADEDTSFDMSKAAVKRMIADARERGYITYDQLNTVMPPDQVSGDQIEDVMSMLSEMGINVVEAEESLRPRRRGGVHRVLRLARTGGGQLHHGKPGPYRRPGADVSARDGLGRAAVARG